MLFRQYNLQIWLVLIGLSLVNISFAQEPPRIKDFGSSLKQIRKKSKSDKVKKKASNEEIISVNTNLVVSEILVLDRKGLAVTGLQQDDFIITEDAKSQQVEIFSLGDSVKIPRSVVLIIDYSGSQIAYLENSIEAAKSLIDKLNPEDRVALVTDDVKVLQDFSRDKSLLKQKLDSLKETALAGNFGRSMQYSALMSVLNELFSEEDVRPIVIFQTDGDELFELRPQTPKPTSIEDRLVVDNRPFTFEDLRLTVEKSRASIYTIIPGASLIGTSPEERTKRAKESVEFEQLQMAKALKSKSLKKMPDGFYAERGKVRYREQSALISLTNLSGGFADFLEKPEQADEIYAKILFSLNTRYILGYYSNNQEQSDKIRRVKIEIRNHPDYVVWGRKSYVFSEK